MKGRFALGALVALGALAITGTAWAHARVSPPTALANQLQEFTLAVPTEKENASPPTALANQLQEFTLAVPTEKENATTTTIEMTPPKGFGIDSFSPSPGWKRSVQQSGSGEEAVVTKVTWTGGSVPTGEDATFSFLASTSGSGDYTFDVKQTYSDGSVVDWADPESGDSPAPVVKAVSSFGGGTSILSIVALVVGIVGVVLGAIALLVRGGRQLA